MKKIVIGSRGSKLSLAYVAKVEELILKKGSKIEEIQIFKKIIKTSGDIFQNKKLSEIGGKKLFCKEIEEKLLNNEIDLAVHSLKDMETEEDQNLIIGAFIKRNDPRDVFISSKFQSLKELKKDSVVGSSSRRRELQMKLINKNISVSEMRGNIDTRIEKIENGKLDGIIIASAGVKTLNYENKIKETFSIDKMLPAAGQGVIAVQCRKNDEIIKKMLKEINDDETKFCAISERNVLSEIGGNCDTAVGALASLEGNKINLKAQLFSDDGKKSFSYEMTDNKEKADSLGKKVGIKLLELAGSNFKKK